MTLVEELAPAAVESVTGLPLEHEPTAEEPKRRRATHERARASIEAARLRGPDRIEIRDGRAFTVYRLPGND